MPLLKRLIEEDVQCVVIGGVAATVHGSARVTKDLDVCAPLSEVNIPRILAALRGTRPTHRMRPHRLPVADDPARFKGFKNLNIELKVIQRESASGHEESEPPRM